MFWKFNLLTTSHVDTLLDKEDVTLTELMDEDDILQECKAQNRKLVDFLARPEYMEEMVRLITVEPPDDVDEKIRFKYPNTACELLTADVSQINEKLAGDEELVNKLYAFLEGPKPLNPLLASFFSKVMGLLITRKSEMIFEYLKSKDDFVGRLLHHIGTSAVMDLLLRLITCIESVDTRKAVIEWLNKENIVIRLVDSIVVLKEEDIHCNAAQSLCDIVRLGREQFIQQQESSDPDPLLFTMEQEETVSQLLSNMFNSNKNESVLVNGLCVIHTLLEIRKQGVELCDHLPNGETDRSTQGISNVIAALIPRLKDFHDLLINPPKQFYNSMPTSCGCLDPPLGNTRLQVAKLITALVGANMHQVNLELASLGTIQTLMDLCFKYEWNNFLHTQIEQCLLLILNNGPIEIDGKLKSPLLTQLFTEYNFIQRMLSEWEENEQQQSTKNGKRRGFMGHLTKLANCISGLLEKNTTTNLVKDHFGVLSQEVRDRWNAFVAGSLADVNKKNMIELMRGHPLVSSSEDDDADFKDIPFPQDSTMQQAFADFQLQQMTSNFIDQFGFNDEEFADQEGKIEANFAGKISSIGADFQANVNQASAVFEQVCSERSQQFDDDSDEDIWEEKPITFDKTAQHARLERLQGATARCNSSDEDSTDSGEELDSPVKITQQPAEGMDVDNSEGQWCADSSSQSEHTAMDIAYSPWEKPSPATAPSTTTTSTSTASEGWADFSELPSQSENEENWADFSNFSDLQSSVTQEPRMCSPVEMDTYESTRGNPYVVSSNSDSQTSSVSVLATVTLQGASEMCVTDLEDDEAINPQPDSTSSSLPATKTSGSSDSIVVNNSRQHPTQTSTPALSLHFTAHTTQSVESSSTDSQVSSTSESVSESSNDSLRLQPASSMAVHTSSSSDQLATTPASEVGSSASDASVANLNTGVSSSHQIVMAGGSLDNQSFLTSTGLMKRPSATASRSWPSSDSQSNGPVTSTAVLPVTSAPQLAHMVSMADGDSGSQEPDTTQCSLTSVQRIELARSEGAEAQELLDASTGVLQNGPV